MVTSQDAVKVEVQMVVMDVSPLLTTRQVKASFRSLFKKNLRLSQLTLTTLVNQLWFSSLKMLLKQLLEFGVLAVEEEADSLMTTNLVDPVVGHKKLLTSLQDNNSL
jgi:hypothetical protein